MTFKAFRKRLDAQDEIIRIMGETLTAYAARFKGLYDEIDDLNGEVDNIYSILGVPDESDEVIHPADLIPESPEDLTAFIEDITS